MQISVRLSLIDWLHEILNYLGQSNWTEVLVYKNVNLASVLDARIYTRFLRIARQTPPAVSVPITWYERLGVIPRRIITRGLSSLASSKPRRSDVVFWPREFTHIEAQLPVAQALRKMGLKVQFVACQDRIWHALWKRGEHTVFTDRAWGSDLKTVRAKGAAATQFLEQPAGVVFPAFNDFVPTQRVEIELRQLLQILLPGAFSSVYNAEEVIARCEPGVLVVGNDLTLEGRAACLKASQYGLSTASLMHGSVSGEPLHNLHIADRFLVYGEDSRRELMKLGLQPEQVIACGAPYLDERAQQTDRPHPVLARHLGLHPGQSWVLLAASGAGLNTSLEHHLRLLKAVARLSAKMPDVLFVSKLHRKRDKLEYYQAVSQCVPGSHLVPISYETSGIPKDIYDWLQGCSLVITGASSVANEALLMEVPVITVDLMGEFLKVNFINARATHHVKNEEELYEMVTAILYRSNEIANIPPQSQHYLTDFFGPLDRGSAKRCAEAIIALA